jgi:DNA polymerase-3 subunit delta'
LLKTLEEPPAGVVIVLCADQELRLLPTVRSRCARIRLGLVGSRDIEAIVGDHDLADPPMAARLGRLAGGRPGLALAYARAPEAILIRAELSRVLLDLTVAGPAARLAAVRAAIPRAIALATALAGDESRPAPRSRKRGRDATPQEVSPITPASEESVADAVDDGPARAVPATERRRAAELLIALWADVGRDLALARSGGGRSVRDPVMLEELASASAGLDPASISAFLERAARAAELLASNVSPELLLDALALAWPRGRAVA